MVSGHDLDLVARIGAGTVSGVLGADDPAAVADAVARDHGFRCVEVDALACAIAAARVRVAEVVVARAREAERDVAVAVDGRAGPHQTGAAAATDDDWEADRQAVRFSLVILVLALVGGSAVYAADGLVLAPVLPAAALLVLALMVVAHRRPSTDVPDQALPVPSDETVDADVDDLHVVAAPAVRAAEAHLRRQQAAWKVSWWERAEAVPDIGSWSPDPATAVPLTLVAVDPSGDVDACAHATMTATAPAAVSVVVLQARG